MKNIPTKMVSVDYILFHFQEQSKSCKPPVTSDGNKQPNIPFHGDIINQQQCSLCQPMKETCERNIIIYFKNILG